MFDRLIDRARPAADALAVLAVSVVAFAHVRAVEPPLPPEVAQAELPRAIRDGNSKRVGELLVAGAKVNGRDEWGNTPLILAALYAGPDCVKLLLDHGAEVNAASEAGATALLRAATDPGKARLLIEAGANVNARTDLGTTPLLVAARSHGNAATVKLLLDRGASVTAVNEHGDGVMPIAAASGDLETVRLLLDRGGNVNDRGTRRTPLGWAAFQNDLPMMHLMLERKADPNLSSHSTFGNTALIQAAWHNNVDAARLLLERGARVSVTDLVGFNALHWATAIDVPQPELITLLLDRGANPNTVGGEAIDSYLAEPQTPLMLALRHGSSPAAEILKARGGVARSVTSVATRTARKLPNVLSRDVVMHATARAIALLQSTSARSVGTFLRHSSRQDCVSCHQQYLPMIAVGHARDRGVSVDRELAQDQVELIQRLGRRSAEPAFEIDYVLELVFQPEAAHTFGYELFGLAAERVPHGPLTDSRVHHLASIQAADGRWYFNLPRPPIQASDVSATALAIQVLRRFGWPGRKAEFDQRVDRARQWLWTVTSETTEDAVYQLLGLHWSGEPAERLERLARSLSARQRADGGWAQLSTLDSDAYATGQVLYALARAAGRPTSDSGWQRGLRFLLSSQFDDGSWHVVRRAVPFQPTMASTFPHGRDSWISAAGTSWAVMALTEAIGPTVPAEPTVDFARQIKPLLERSCVACHGPDRQRGDFRVDSRESILKAGNSGLAAVVPGASAQSTLVDCLTGRASELEMPPPSQRGRFPALTAPEVEVIRRWIDQGAVWPASMTLQTPSRK